MSIRRSTAAPTPGPGSAAGRRRVWNFGAGPAVLPQPVLERIRDELLDFRGMGASIVEISHRSPQFHELLDETDELLRTLLRLPAGYRILYTHGGGQMQFAIAALNLLGLKPARKALYVDTGSFAARAAEAATQWGYVHTVASSRNTGYDRIPAIDPDRLGADASYLHITTNNSAMGTRWTVFPETDGLPLVADMTSEILSREVDIARFGLVYAAAQKNLAPPGLAVVFAREDLLGHALPETPTLLNLKVLDEHHSLLNTLNTFAMYVMRLVLEWMQGEGGISAIERRNEEKAAALYRAVDHSGFYGGFARPEHRSTMNVTFDLPDAELRERFVAQAEAEGLHALTGHVHRGGVRASLYNAMPLAGAQALADFMTEFERRNG